MALYQTALKNTLAARYAAVITYASALSALGTAQGVGTEVSPRVALAWGAPSNGAVVSGAAALAVNSGSTVVGVGLWDSAAGAGTNYDQASVTSQGFSSNGTYTASITYTQS